MSLFHRRWRSRLGRLCRSRSPSWAGRIDTRVSLWQSSGGDVRTNAAWARGHELDRGRRPHPHRHCRPPVPFPCHVLRTRPLEVSVWSISAFQAWCGMSTVQTYGDDANRNERTQSPPRRWQTATCKLSWPGSYLSADRSAGTLRSNIGGEGDPAQSIIVGGGIVAVLLRTMYVSPLIDGDLNPLPQPSIPRLVASTTRSSMKIRARRVANHCPPGPRAPIRSPSRWRLDG